MRRSCRNGRPLNERGSISLKCTRCLHCLLLLVTVTVFVGSSRSSCAQDQHRLAGVPVSTIDARTRWAFRTRSPATVSSPIIRLGDVVEPLDPNLGGWSRLCRSPIGLLPLGSQPLTIDRDRLERAILDAEATPLAIDWYGPRKIKVSYLQAEDGGASAVTQVSHRRPTEPGDGSSTVPAGATHPSTSRRVDVDRIVQWIELAVGRSEHDLATEFQVEIPRDQPNFGELSELIGVTEISSLETIEAGRCRFRIKGRSKQGPVETEIALTLKPHPKVAVPRRALPRGHRISAGDLEMQSLPEGELTPEHVMDVAEVIGMEVHGTAPARRPLVRSNLGAPTLIRRGDLIEVRVVGGGVTVTTHAKSLDDGAAGDLVEVESMEPRKRLLARVVEPGLVEIITRAPKVRP